MSVRSVEVVMEGNLSQIPEDTIELIDRLCENQRYQEALDVVKQNPTEEDAKIHLLYRFLYAVDQVEDPLTLGKEHGEALVGLITMSPEHIMLFSYIELICISYYPHKVPAMLATFMKVEGLDQKKFMQNIFAALESYLSHFLFLNCGKRKNDRRWLRCFLGTITRVQTDDHKRVCPCNEEETCTSVDIASFVLSACKPLHYGSSFDAELVHLDTSSHAEHYPLFCKAACNDLLEEARLLYETGAVNNSELAFLAQREPEIQMILDEDEETPMAKFLRSVLRQPRSLFSAASLEVSRLLGHDIRGRQDRAKSLGLPQAAYDEVMFIRSVSDYRSGVMLRYKRKNNEEN